MLIWWSINQLIDYYNAVYVLACMGTYTAADRYRSSHIFRSVFNCAKLKLSCTFFSVWLLLLFFFKCAYLINYCTYTISIVAKVNYCTYPAAAKGWLLARSFVSSTDINVRTYGEIINLDWSMTTMTFWLLWGIIFYLYVCIRTCIHSTVPYRRALRPGS